MSPPLGRVDNSVLIGVAELFAFAVLWFLKDAFFAKGDKKLKASVKIGDNSVTIEGEKDEEEESN